MNKKTADAVLGDDVYVPNNTTDGTQYLGDDFLSDEVIRDLRDHNMTFRTKKERGEWKMKRAIELLEEAREDLDFE